MYINMADKNINLRKYLPDILREVSDFDKLMTALEEGLQSFADNIYGSNRIINEGFVKTAGDDSLSRFEYILGLPRGCGDDRVAAILNRIKNRPPFTVRFLQELLNKEPFKEGCYTVNANHKERALYIKIKDSPDINYTGLKPLLWRIIPANMVILLQSEVSARYTNNTLHYPAFAVRTAFQNYAPLLNGWRPLNDSWELDEEYMRMSFPEFAVSEYSFKNHNDFSGVSITIIKMFKLDGSVLLNGSCRLTYKNEETITFKNMYYLDGSVLLNGSRRLAYKNEEAI